jgi:hypothetical protein
MSSKLLLAIAVSAALCAAAPQAAPELALSEVKDLEDLRIRIEFCQS